MGMARGAVWSRSLRDPRPYIFQPAVYGGLIYTVIYMSDRLRLLTQGNPSPRLPPPADLRSSVRRCLAGTSANHAHEASLSKYSPPNRNTHRLLFRRVSTKNSTCSGGVGEDAATMVGFRGR